MTQTGNRKTTAIRVLAAGLAVALTAGVANAETRLQPGKGYDPAQIRQADKLYTDFRTGKLGSKGTTYWSAYQSARKNAQATVGGLVANNAVGSCFCTATCQTVLVVNGGSVYFEGTGTVSSPSACADAAEAFCGSAVSTFLHHWNCK